MAAPLTDEGRSPAVQKVTVAEYRYFIQICDEAPKPNLELIALLRATKRAK